MTFNFDRELVACMPELERYARRLARNVAQAEDLVQSCVERALRNRDRFEPGSNMPAWLCTILKNLHFTNCKRARRISETEVTEGMIVAGPAQEWQIMLRETGEALERLKPSQRRLIRAVAVDGECYQDAADALNVSIGTVRSRLSRARAELRLAGAGGAPRGRVRASASAGETACAASPPTPRRSAASRAAASAESSGTAHTRRSSARPAPRRPGSRRPADAPSVPLLPKRTMIGRVGTRGLAGLLAATVSLCVAWSPPPAAALDENPPARFGMAMHGSPKYQPGFDHFSYVNPRAPAGGTVTLAGVGGFDTLNPFTIRGVAASGLSSLYDTLMAPSLDEPFSQYPLVAESVRVAEDLSWVEYSLNPAARFHDGHPVTPEDVIFTFRTLRDTHPFHAAYYAGVSEVRSTGGRSVRFDLKPGDNRELPMILGQLPVLPAHYWKSRDFTATTLEPPLGGGPYRILSVDPGRSITYGRVEDYWARDLPVNRGRHNFSAITYDYYLDPTVALTAFKGGLVDFRIESTAKDWATAYNTADARSGRLLREEIPISLPAGMQGYVFNTRRAVFTDPRVRYAIAHAFDFQWANRVLFHGAYKRTDSYFENSDLAAEGLPDKRELALLAPLKGQVPEEVFTDPYRPPSASTSLELRENLLKADRLLEQAGWVTRNGRRVEAATGLPLTFEILLNNPSFERVTLPLVDNLRRLGIEARVRTVDTAQYQNRIQSFDFDMVVHQWAQSLSPGNEQRNYWTSSAAASPGSENLAGIRDPAVDRLVELLIQARTREELEARAAALDRVLLWGHYVIPHWHSGVVRVAYWDKLEHPANLPPFGIAFDAWWVEAAAEAVGEAR